MPTKLWVLMNDDELACILALGKIALLVIMENGLNGRRNGRRIANYQRYSGHEEAAARTRLNMETRTK